MSVVRWLAARPWTLAMVTWLILAIPGFLVVQRNNSVTEDNGRRTDAFVECLTDWANETSGRSSVLTKATQDRDEAIGRILRDAANRDGEAIVRDLALYVKVDDDRRALLAANPIPDPPVLRCRR